MTPADEPPADTPLVDKPLAEKPAENAPIEMTLAEILRSLFPVGHSVAILSGAEEGVVAGTGMLAGRREAYVIGIADGTPLGVDQAIAMAGEVLEVLRAGGDAPILVLVDSDSQRMSRRDELLGLSEYLAHLAKCLIQADLAGHHTVGILYGHSAAGAFIATALATRTLVALPGAAPEVMDLPSMARVTKLSLEVLQEKARSTPVFAPGLANLAQTGAVLATLDAKRSLADQVLALLASKDDRADRRDALGLARAGRPKAASIARRVHDLALRPG